MRRQRAAVDPQADRLRFNFRFAPWADVLTWFADRADLSLVLDAPPAGTFNYTDSRSYTTAEAIDLLNGVLLSKGYALVRRDRMLLLIPLDKGLPAGALPQVSPEELEARGANELVSVLLPLGKRDATEVSAEIKPLLGAFGEVKSLPVTRQLLVSDTVAKLRRVRELIALIPEPKVAAAPPPSAAPEAAVLVAYPLGTITTQAALDLARALVPDAKAVLEDRTGQLLLLGVPAQQAALKSALELMQSEPALERRPVLRTHSIRRGDPAQFITLLKPLVPGAQLTADTTRGLIVAVAPESQQEQIASTLATAAGVVVGSAADSPEFTVQAYPLTQGDPAQVVTLLQGLVPQARFVADPKTRSVLALATASEQQTIRTTVEQLESRAGTNAAGRLESYPLVARESSTVLPLLKAAAPEAQITFDATRDRLLVVARDVDQQKIRQTLAGLEADGQAEPSTLEVYTLDDALRKRVLAVLDTMTSELTGVTRVIDDESGTLSIRARPDQHALVDAVVTQLRTENPSLTARQLVAYRLRFADPTAVSAALQSALPGVKLTVELKTRSLLAWARPEEHAQLRATIESLDTDVPAEDRRQLTAHPLGRVDATAAITVLQGLLPDVRFTSDTTARTIVALATAGEHEQVSGALDRLRPEVPEELRPRLVVYPLKYADAPTVQQLVQPLVPEAKLNSDRATSRLAALATPAEHEQIRTALEQSDRAPDGPTQLRVVTYKVDPSQATDVITLLAALVPAARLRADATTGQLVCVAAEAEQQQVRAALEQLGADQPAIGAKLERYDVSGADPSLIAQLLQTAVPEARIIADVRTNAVLAWARPDRQQAIAENLKTLAANQPDRKPSVKVYRPLRADVSAAYTAIQAQVPYARLAIDTRTGSLVATGTPEEHETIRSALTQLDSVEDDVEAPKLVVYEVRSADPSNVLTVLRNFFGSRPDVQLSLDTKTSKLLIRAPREQQELTARLLREVEGDSAVTTNAQLMVHPLGAADPQVVSQVVSALLAKAPEAKVIGDGRSGQLIVMARPELQASVKASIAELQASSPVVEVLTLVAVDPFEAAQAIKNLFSNTSSGSPPAPTVDADAQQQRLVIRGTKDQQQQIRNLLTKLGEPMLAQRDQENAKKLRVVAVPGRNTEQLIEQLQQLWPKFSRNPIRVVTPSAVVPTWRHSRKARPETQPQTPAPTAPQGQTSAVPYWVLPALLGWPEDAESQPEPQPKTPDEAAPAAQETSDELPTIVIAPGQGSVTIACDDPAVLEQLETLLRTLAAQGGASGRDFTVFPLKNAPASGVAELLKKIYGSAFPGFSGSGSVSVVADVRLNAVIVKAGPNDLEAIEGLLEVLDTADVPTSAVSSRVERIVVANTDAIEIAAVVRDIFRAALSTSNNRQQLAVPSGVSREVSALLEGINRGASGPEMTLGVDARTNSLVVFAPEALLKEVREVVQQLDEAARDSARTVRVVQLQNTSAEAVRRVLETLGREPSRSRRNRSSSFNPESTSQ